MPETITPLTEEQKQLVERNIPLALSYVGSLKYKIRDLDERKRLCEYALVVAARRFDPNLGYKFSTYYHQVVTGYSRHYMRDMAKNREFKPFSEVGELLLRQTPSKTRQIDPEAAEIWDLAMSKLPPREREVIILRMERGLSLAEAGKELNVTGERVRQIEASALANVRKYHEIAVKMRARRHSRSAV